MANKKHLFIRSYIFMLLFLEISIFCSGQALIQNVSETIQTASNREFSNSKGGPENNKLSDVKGNARGGEYAFMHYVNKKGERSELAMARTEIGSEYWYGWSMLVPEDFDFSGSYSIVAQWASYPSPRNGKFKCGANGSYMVITAEGALEFRLQFAGKNEDSDCLKFVLIENISKYRGKWFDFVINARWTGNDDGFLKMWIKADDNNYFQKISYKGPTWWNDEDKGPYLKVGLYMGDPGWKGPEERTLFTDEIRIADEKQSFNDVAPPGAVARKKESGQGNVEYITYHSKLNRADIPVMVYTPPGYYSGKQKYPSIYNFHGSGGGSPARQWDRVYRTLTDAIEKGLADPVIYVFVNGMGDRFYANYEEDSLFIERSIITELIPFIDQHYRTVASGKFRAADGFSMGGFGALMIAMKHPDLFSSVVSYGAALIGADRAVRPGELFSSEDHFSQYNPFMLATLNRNKIRKGLAVRLVCGDQDSLMKNNISFINHMDSLRIEVDFVEVKGLAHDTKGLFRETGIESLKFIWKHFKHW